MRDGGTAFPTQDVYHPGGETEYGQNGMSLRDYFAAKALPAAWDSFAKGYWTCEAEDTNIQVARCAYQMADAMLKAREETNS